MSVQLYDVEGDSDETAHPLAGSLPAHVPLTVPDGEVWVTVQLVGVYPEGAVHDSTALDAVTDPAENPDAAPIVPADAWA